MSNGESKPSRRDRALKAARRRLRLLEIETHRIKAELARLEAEFEDDLADRLAGRLRRRMPLESRRRADVPHGPPSPQPHFESETSPSTPADRKFDRADDGIARPAVEVGTYHSKSELAADSELQLLSLDMDPRTTRWRGRSTRAYRRTTRPMLLSLGLHALVLLLSLPLGFATLAHENVALLASPPPASDETAEELAEIEIEAPDWEDVELQNVVLDQPQFNLSDSLLADLAPLDSLSAADAAHEFGQVDALLSDLGTLMAGAGDMDGGQAGGPPGSAIFFGTRSRGDRFVFVVDNSDSMSGGRLEAAIAELVASVDAMSPRQSFYVIFVSDRPYPMFYPAQAPALLPATPENKKRLGEWLTRVIRAPGRNRELIKAMDMAAALHPHAVFFLWDGRIDHAGVRQDVMTHLTRPNQWNFAIHTLGMGVDKLDSEYNLQAIAAASGGTYRRVNVPRAPAR